MVAAASGTNKSTQRESNSRFGHYGSTWFDRPVIAAGITRAMGYFFYETATGNLPGFFAVLGIPSGLLGLIEAIAQGVASFAELLARYIADKRDHRKLLVVDYFLTPLGQAFIALASGWPLIPLGRVFFWFGKGLRGSFAGCNRNPVGYPGNLREGVLSSQVCWHKW